MLELKKHPYFKEYTDPKSGVVSYFLTEKVAGIHKHFYFTECSLTDDGKYLWITSIYPPARYAHLSVVSMDPENPFIRPLRHVGSGGGGCCCIIPGTDDILYGANGCMWRVTPEGEMTKVLELSEDFINNRSLGCMSTHASISCDGKLVALDIELGGKWYVGTGNLETGEVKILNNFGRCYDHTQFSPTDPELFLLDQEWWRDPATGEYFCIDNRMWLMDIHGTRFEPLIQSSWYTHDGTEYAHDFWSRDGLVCWVEYKTGAYECDIKTREVNHVWKRPMCHCHTLDRKLWVADETPYAWRERPCRVLFYDRETNKEIDIFSAQPYPKIGNVYHTDPHPSFTKDGEYVISTTTLLDGNADVAITPVKPLLELCRENGTVVK